MSTIKIEAIKMEGDEKIRRNDEAESRAEQSALPELDYGLRCTSKLV